MKKSKRLKAITFPDKVIVIDKDIRSAKNLMRTKTEARECYDIYIHHERCTGRKATTRILSLTPEIDRESLQKWYRTDWMKSQRVNLNTESYRTYAAEIATETITKIEVKTISLDEKTDA